jgi:hypothetical protein
MGECMHSIGRRTAVAASVAEMHADSAVTVTSVRSRREATAALLLVCSITGFVSGCSAADDAPVAEGPESSPSTPTSAVTPCAPTDTDVVWEPMVEAPAADLGHRVLTVGDDGTQGHIDEHVPYSSALQTADGVAAGDDEVLDYVVQDFVASGQTESDRLGDPPADFGRVSVTTIAAGTYVMGYRVSQFTSAFTLTCGGEDVGTGTLLSSLGNDVGGTLVDCARTPSRGADAYSLALMDSCPAQ